MSSGFAIVFILCFQQATQKLGNHKIVDLRRVGITQVDNAHMTRKGQVFIGKRPCLRVIKNLQPDQLPQPPLDHSPACWMCKLFFALPFKNGNDFSPPLPEIPAEETIISSGKIIQFFFTSSKFST